MVSANSREGGGSDQSLLVCAGTHGLPGTTRALDATQTPRAPVPRDARADRALVFLTTLAGGATAEINPNHIYVFFLSPIRGYPGSEYLAGVAQPWLFDISDKMVSPVSPWEGAARYFPPISATEFIQQVLSNVKGP